MRTRQIIVALVALSLPLGSYARSAEPEATPPTFLKKVEKFFGGPVPTPTPKKKKKTSTKKKSTPTPSPRPKSSPKRTPTPTPTPEASTSPSIAPSETAEESPSPTPKRKATTTPTPSPTESPTPTPEPSASRSPTPSATKTPRPSPGEGKKELTVSISPHEIAGYEKNPEEIRHVLDLALDLTTQNLGYKYGSADPANGGMDCSGFIHYVLSKTGMKDVPRDAREQYIWVRKAGKFQAVLGRSESTFEIDALKPGDLMFWAGTYNVDRDPAITHTMIYLGREKATNQRIMVGASDGRTYKGQSRFGVSVFDFKLAGRRATSDDKPGPTFVGYASIPGLREH